MAYFTGHQPLAVDFDPLTRNDVSSSLVWQMVLVVNETVLFALPLT